MLGPLCKGQRWTLCPKKLHIIPSTAGSFAPSFLWFTCVWNKRVKIHSPWAHGSSRGLLSWRLPLPSLRRVPYPIHAGQVCKSWVSHIDRRAGNWPETGWSMKTSLQTDGGPSWLLSAPTGPSDMELIHFHLSESITLWIPSLPSKTLASVCAPQAASLMPHEENASPRARKPDC